MIFSTGYKSEVKITDKTKHLHSNLPFLLDQIINFKLDTDSCTLALTKDSIDDLVLPERRKEWFDRIRPQWFADENSDYSQKCPG